ncbi:MAG: DUF1592 domain-containing protein [Opitutales bacterium]
MRAFTFGDGEGEVSFSEEIEPLMRRNCFRCHGDNRQRADLNLQQYGGDIDLILEDRDIWLRVLHNVHTREMPPEDSRQPSQEDRDLLVAWIEQGIFQVDCDNPDPGRVTIRRLNRAEYNNTIRDLIGIDFKPAENFPSDDSGYGFDNIGDVLSMPPVLLERYLDAAVSILNAAIVTEPEAVSSQRFDVDELEGGASYNTQSRILSTETALVANVEFSSSGEYVIRAKAFGHQAGPDPAKMAFLVDGEEIEVVDVPAVEEDPRVYETRIEVEEGAREVAVAFTNDYYMPNHYDPDLRGDRNLIVHFLEIEGPVDARPELPETHRRIFTYDSTPETAEEQEEAAREILANFAQRAYRRPVASAEVERLLPLVDMAIGHGETFEAGIALAMQAVMISPHFLFRGELQPEPDNPHSVHPVNEYAMASRLSYFLWSSMPDAELFAHAEAGTLRENLETQVIRMLEDPKAEALVDNFAGQWLQLRNLQLVNPSAEMFPDFDDSLRWAMEEETRLFFEAIMREDRSVLEFLDADYTFVNERLARHYGIDGVQGDGFQRVSLEGTGRGGVLTHASVLTITSNSDRTSPVNRGLWVLENILGTPPPPAPPNVPELEESNGAVLVGTLRERLEQHRDDPNCASCHARMDPIGFGFEHFDPVGAWRDQDGEESIDAAGVLTSGEAFYGAEELRAVLLEARREEFLRAISSKMLTYALGRGVEYYDRCAITEISEELAANGYTFSTLVIEVVKSTPFQLRRGEGDRLVRGDP